MSEKYDVVIIGAGIGGLVCGCYLAKAGLKVLIVEQHDKPGGCCSSFDRQGYRFDVGVHYLGSLREEGILTGILNEFTLLDRIKFLRNDPTDRIITPDKTVFIRKDKLKTRTELITHFPAEKNNIDNFFNFILNDDFLYIVSKTKKKTFKELLDAFFRDYKLKAVLAILFGNLGLPASKASALVATILYREYILDGGYYPRGGIQVFPDLLVSRFKEYGGEILFSTKVVKIITKCKKICGAKLEDDVFISAKIIVSNADASETFNQLLDCYTKEKKIANILKPSPSAFVIYLGLDKELNITPKHYTTWFFPTYNIEKSYGKNDKLLKGYAPDYLLCTFPSLVDSTLVPKGKSILRILIGTNFKNKYLWERNKEKIAKRIIQQVSYLVPNIQNYIKIKEIATPETFYNFTSNRSGALFGWSSIPSQLDKNLFPSLTSIDNLYLAGHWVTNGIGQGSVSLVALCGKNTARSIIRKLRR